ncbi:bifunctional serine/threonine-protein kinase/formylglycine-generating enzyme family protein [Duganella callida]|uniref:Protein kinase domain-containing protein n=1 Tax=Duganella callida TaxID=2561932 RepID=A0A4Y9SUT2_9BURK|nr:bifunctional serine/threonine-protein kinase/formylglycine-generating enzyme family protein [Duganella callida]TFW28413.1 hypothetical protein E4L98_05665 [Duganella callida]
MNSPPNDDDHTVLAPAPAFPNALAAGTLLGEFEITRVIGQGGFGIVYLARDHSLGRDVALKEYMPAAFAGRTGDTQVTILSTHYEETFKVGLSSFVKEAQLLARFDHPSLVKVYRFWEANGTGYMVMPYYQAPTLKQMLKQGHAELSTEAWLKTFLGQILDALQVLHDKQCYHRDISPDNILMLGEEVPLLLDFGAARRVIGDVTQALTVILKPGYAPIEQYGEMGDHMSQGPWTDLYALASVIYFIIMGKVPQAAMSRLAADNMPKLVDTAAGRYSPEFLAAIDAALSVRPEHRPQTAAAFRLLLQLEQTPTTQRHMPSTVVVEEDVPPVTAPATRQTATTGHKHSQPVSAPGTGKPETPNTFAPAATGVPAAQAAGQKRKLPLIPIAAVAAVVVTVAAVFALSGGQERKPAAPAAAVTPVPAPAPAAVDAPAAPPTCPLRRADGGSACPVMVPIPAGSYRIGSQPGDRNAAPEEYGGTPQAVAAFQLSAYEVTTGQWQMCVADGVCGAPPDAVANADMPVTNVSWDAVQTYIAWLSSKTGTKYRLPTEVEWEYAARAGAGTLYPWGDRIGDKRAHCGQCGTLGDHPQAEPVGRFAAYGGLYDMVGNVYEWVADCWLPSHEGANAAALSNATCQKKVQKGGAFDSMSADVRPVARTAGERDKGDPRVGFRLAR